MNPILLEFKTMTVEDMIVEFQVYEIISRGNDKIFNELVDLFWQHVAEAISSEVL